MNPVVSFRKFLAVIAVAACSTSFCSTVFGQYDKASDPPAELKEGFEAITIEQSKEWLGILAGPKFEGRGTGQPGYTKAAHWVAGKLAEFGLEPIGDNGTFFQMLPMKRRLPVIEECFIEGPDGMKVEGLGKLGFDRYTDNQETTGEIVFVNFPNDNAEIPEEVSLRDKIVIYSSPINSKSAAVKIQRKRPAAFLRVVEGVPGSLSQLVRKGRRGRSTNVSGTINQEAADGMVTAFKGEDWLKRTEDEDAKTVAVHETGESVTLRMRYREEQAAVPNVVAWLEGSDPKLKHEYVVVGSHLDHLGIQGGQVFPGADDNGSGSTAVLNIAKAFATNSTRPKRSVMFIWFAAEEIGLVGSRHYTDNPTKSLDNMTCMFNIDMVGRNEETKDETSEENEGSIHLVGSMKGETDLHSLVLEANKHVGFRFELDEERVWNRSDQVNFYRKGVPVAFLFGGFHPDYHRPSDKVSEINFKKIVSAAKLYYGAINLASEHGRFQMKETKKEK
ncbi:MAG: M20/M25/M40 family metallo-hydrolase [Mariniblastus sp.]